MYTDARKHKNIANKLERNITLKQKHECLIVEDIYQWNC